MSRVSYGIEISIKASPPTQLPWQNYIKARSVDSDKAVSYYPVITSEARIPVITSSEIVSQRRLLRKYKSIGDEQAHEDERFMEMIVRRRIKI